ncbi:unnamed protein product [Diabrotica balteata]|uniref:DUF8207 domain-containing protein n=1 Tax=Diabrotica balteata TaxID=107213 RepID=A0A9N9XL04_DIABA|nr:unnamed protein product [Diabrotica balteata]
MEKTWTVVKFPDENDAVEVVPTSWLYEELYYWPPFTKNTIRETIERCSSPDKNWPSFKFEHLKNNVAGSCQETKRKVYYATQKSDLESDSQSYIARGLKKRKILKKDLNSNIQKDTPSTSRGASSSLPALVSVFKIHLDYFLDTATNHIIIEHLKRLLKKQNILQSMLQDVVSDIDEIKKRLNKRDEENSLQVQGHASSLFTELEYLPVGNQQELDKFETYPSEEVNMKKSVMALYKIGGKNVYDFIFRATGLLISDKFAGAEYSFLCRKSKKSFKALKFSELLVRCRLVNNISSSKVFREMENTHNIYFQKYWQNSQDIDLAYGVKYDWRTSRWLLGEKEIIFRDGHIQIDDKTFNSTNGLYNLIFYKKPQKYTPNDLSIYKQLLEFSGVHRDCKGRLRHRGDIRKFESIIRPLFISKRKRKNRQATKFLNAQVNKLIPPFPLYTDNIQVHDDDDDKGYAVVNNAIKHTKFIEKNTQEDLNSKPKIRRGYIRNGEIHYV